MLERNKTIFKILLIVSAVIFVGGLITLLLRRPIVWADVCFYFFFILFIHGVIVLTIKFPKINNKKRTIVRRNGKLRFEQIDYSKDPNGYNYIMMGMLSLLFTILITLYNLTQNEIVLLWSVIVLLVIFIPLCIFFTNKIANNQ